MRSPLARTSKLLTSAVVAALLVLSPAQPQAQLNKALLGARATLNYTGTSSGQVVGSGTFITNTSGTWAFTVTRAITISFNGIAHGGAGGNALGATADQNGGGGGGSGAFTTNSSVSFLPGNTYTLTVPAGLAQLTLVNTTTSTTLVSLSPGGSGGDPTAGTAGGVTTCTPGGCTAGAAGGAGDIQSSTGGAGGTASASGAGGGGGGQSATPVGGPYPGGNGKDQSGGTGTGGLFGGDGGGRTFSGTFCGWGGAGASNDNTNDRGGHTGGVACASLAF